MTHTQTPALVFAMEKLDDALIEQMTPLIHAHAAEVEAFGGRAPDPDWPRWQLLADMGLLLIFTARRSGSLVGYLCYLIEDDAQCRGLLVARAQALYMDAAHRGGAGMRLVRFSEPVLKNIGVSTVVQHVPVCHDHSPALERIGYTHAYRILTKELADA